MSLGWWTTFDGQLSVEVADADRDASSAFCVIDAAQRRDVDPTSPVYVHITRWTNTLHRCPVIIAIR